MPPTHAPTHVQLAGGNVPPCPFFCMCPCAQPCRPRLCPHMCGWQVVEEAKAKVAEMDLEMRRIQYEKDLCNPPPLSGGVHPTPPHAQMHLPPAGRVTGPAPMHRCTPPPAGRVTGPVVVPSTAACTLHNV
eukprot:365183-Chlamydomonas_euryale.AAC.4